MPGETSEKIVTTTTERVVEKIPQAQPQVQGFKVTTDVQPIQVMPVDNQYQQAVVEQQYTHGQPQPTLIPSKVLITEEQHHNKEIIKEEKQQEKDLIKLQKEQEKLLKKEEKEREKEEKNLMKEQQKQEKEIEKIQKKEMKDREKFTKEALIMSHGPTTTIDPMLAAQQQYQQPYLVVPDILVQNPTIIEPTIGQEQHVHRVEKIVPLQPGQQYVPFSVEEHQQYHDKTKPQEFYEIRDREKAVPIVQQQIPIVHQQQPIIGQGLHSHNERQGQQIITDQCQNMVIDDRSEMKIKGSHQDKIQNIELQKADHYFQKEQTAEQIAEKNRERGLEAQMRAEEAQIKHDLYKQQHGI